MWTSRLPARSSDPCCLVSGCCLSVLCFVPRFLQTAPRGSAPAHHACFTCIRLHRALSPPDCWTCPPHRPLRAAEGVAPRAILDCPRVGCPRHPQVCSGRRPDSLTGKWLLAMPLRQQPRQERAPNSFTTETQHIVFCRQAITSPLGHADRAAPFHSHCVRLLLPGSIRASSRWRPASIPRGCERHISRCTILWAKPTGPTRRCSRQSAAVYCRPSAVNLSVANEHASPPIACRL